MVAIIIGNRAALRAGIATTQNASRAVGSEFQRSERSGGLKPVPDDGVRERQAQETLLATARATLEHAHRPDPGLAPRGDRARAERRLRARRPPRLAHRRPVGASAISLISAALRSLSRVRS